MNPRGIVIHHSLTKDSVTKSWDAIRRYHVETCGWQDIGYHYGIEDIGGKLTILTGRIPDKMGAHTTGFNDSIGICLVGNYDLEPPDEARVALLVTLTVNVLNKYPGLTPSNVHRHSEFAPKSCPGTKFPWVTFIDAVWKEWGI